MCGQQQHENTRASQCKPDHQDSPPKSTSAVMSKHSMLWQITGWPVVAIVVSILIGIGVGVMSMSPPDFVVENLLLPWRLQSWMRKLPIGVRSLRLEQWNA
jgi:hypothetical protein